MGKRIRDDEASDCSSLQSLSQTASSPAKLIELDEDSCSSALTTMQCLLPPHQPLTFASAEEFDVHYAKEHTNRCVSCGKNFPSAHYLTLHIDENHNPVREELAAKGEKTYGCFLEDCDKKCSTPQKRRLHLIDKHMFPKIYNFRIVDQGIDKSNSMLQGGQRRRLSTNSPISHQRRSSMQTLAQPLHQDALPKYEGEMNVGEARDVAPAKLRVNEVNASSAVDKLEKSLSALRFVPSSVRARQQSKKS